jgi:hypothetical protein
MQIDRLNRQLADRFGPDLAVVSADLYGLRGSERDEALDAIVAGDPSPFVFVDGHLVCTGAVDALSVIDALAPARR